VNTPPRCIRCAEEIAPHVPHVVLVGQDLELWLHLGCVRMSRLWGEVVATALEA
jgi:hypothetical protein